MAASQASHGEGSKRRPGVAPTTSTVVPASSATAPRRTAGSPTKTSVPAGASSGSPADYEGRAAADDEVELLVPSRADSRARRALRSHGRRLLVGRVGVDPKDSIPKWRRTGLTSNSARRRTAGDASMLGDREACRPTRRRPRPLRGRGGRGGRCPPRSPRAVAKENARRAASSPPPWKKKSAPLMNVTSSSRRAG